MSISDGVKPARPATLRRDPVVRACQGPARMPRSCILSQTAHVETVQSHAGMPAGHRPSLAWMQRSQQAASSRRRRRTSHRSRCGNATRRSSHGVEGGEHLPATGRRRCDVLHAQDRGGKTHSARGAGLGVAGTGPWVGVASRDGGMRLIYTMQSLSAQVVQVEKHRSGTLIWESLKFNELQLRSLTMPRHREIDLPMHHSFQCLPPKIAGHGPSRREKEAAHPADEELSGHPDESGVAPVVHRFPSGVEESKRSRRSLSLVAVSPDQLVQDGRALTPEPDRLADCCTPLCLHARVQIILDSRPSGKHRTASTTSAIADAAIHKRTTNIPPQRQQGSQRCTGPSTTAPPEEAHQQWRSRSRRFGAAAGAAGSRRQTSLETDEGYGAEMRRWRGIEKRSLHRHRAR
ncbi:unnamed protein product [Diplocarpon coronariae]